MQDEPHIPSRNAEWETPFSPVADVNADADATREARTFSATRRRVAILVTVLLGAWVVAEIVHVIQFTEEQGTSPGRALGVVGAFVVLFRLAVAGDRKTVQSSIFGPGANRSQPVFCRALRSETGRFRPIPHPPAPDRPVRRDLHLE